MNVNVLKGFIEVTKKGLSKKEDILNKIDEINVAIDEINAELGDVDTALMNWLGNPEEENEVKAKKKRLESERTQLSGYCGTLENFLENYRNFDKSICLANIRELLRENQDVKIGQIEREAGIRAGYLSRLEKEGNNSDPSMEFVVTAAKLLKTSLDTLIRVNISELTPTEKYLVSFFEKLQNDTLLDKLDWNIETPDELNHMECGENGWVEHPLFDFATFYEESECEYPDEVQRIVFTSKSFGPKTYINGDCYNIRLKNNSCLYLMDISKSVHKVGDVNAFAKEIWMYTPSVGKKFFARTNDNSPLVPLVEAVFATVKERTQHPKLKTEMQYVIDAFMKDDLEDDPEELPFI